MEKATWKAAHVANQTLLIPSYIRNLCKSAQELNHKEKPAEAQAQQARGQKIFFFC